MALMLIAAGIATVAYMPAGPLTSSAALPVLVAAEMMAGLLVNRVARVPGLPAACAALTSIGFVVAFAFGAGITEVGVLACAMAVPMLMATISPNWALGIHATLILVGAALASAFNASVPDV